MKNLMKTILIGGMFALTLSACNGSQNSNSSDPVTTPTSYPAQAYQMPEGASDCIRHHQFQNRQDMCQQLCGESIQCARQERYEYFQRSCQRRTWQTCQQNPGNPGYR